MNLKQKIYILFIILITLESFISCSKEVYNEKLIQDFSFEIQEFHSKNKTYLFERKKTNIKVISERVITNKYLSYSYKIIEGEGVFEDEDGNKIEENQKVKLDNKKLDFNLFFIPEKEGQIKIIFKVFSQEGNFREKEISFLAEKAPFKFITTTDKTGFINGKINIDLNIIKENLVSQKEYKLTWNKLKGKGIFLNEKGKLLDKGIEIKAGKSKIFYFPQEIGVHSFNLEAEAIDGNKVERNIIYTVTHSNWNFLVSSIANTLELGRKYPIEIQVLENKKNDNSYQILYEVDKNQNIEIQNTKDSKYDLKKGKYVFFSKNYSKNYTIKSKEKCNTSVFFSLKDQNGQIKKDSITVQFSKLPYEFTAEYSNRKTFINKPILFNLKIDSKGKKNKQYKYKFHFEKGAGNLINTNQNILLSNTFISINEGTNTFSYTPKKTGLNSLVFNLIDEQEIKNSLIIKFDVNDIESTFLAEATNQIFLGEKANINISLLQDNSNITTYEIAYFIKGGEGELFDIKTNEVINTSLFYRIKQGNKKILFKPKREGLYSVILKLKNSLGKIIEKEMVIAVLKENWNFEAYSNKNNYLLSDNVRLNFNINSNISNDFYKIKFISNLNGTIEYKGNNYSQGQYFTISKEDLNLSFNPEQEGKYKLVFSIVNSKNEIQEKPVNFNVSKKGIENNQSKFTISAVSEKVNVGVNESTNINIEIEDNTTEKEKYRIKYIIQGINAIVLNDENKPVLQGIYQDTKEGVRHLKFIPQEEGTATINIVLINSFGEEKTVSIKVKVIEKEKNFSLEAFKTKNKELVNNPIPINIILQGSNGNYKMYYRTNKEGILKIGNKEYEPGQYIPIRVGNFSVEFIGKVKGTYSLDFIVESQYGSIKQKNISINYDTVQYEFIVAKESNTMIVDNEQFLNINISEFVGNSTYQIRYIPVGVSVDLFNDKGNKIEPGNFYDIKTENTKWKVKAKEIGEISLDFTVQNATGEKEIKNITINVIQQDYKLLLKSFNNNVVVGNSLDLNAIIKEEIGENNNFKISFFTSKKGELNFEGVKKSQNVPFPISSDKANILTYTGYEIGVHTITFTATSSYGKQITKKIDITYKGIDVSFTATPLNNNPIIINENKTIRFNINEKGGTQKYKLKYVIINNLNGELFKKDGSSITQNSYVDIDNNKFSMDFKGLSRGTIYLEFFIKGSDGREFKAKRISIKTEERDYILSVNPKKSDELIGKKITINYTISEIGRKGFKYTLSFSNGGKKGTLIVNNKEYKEGDIIPILGLSGNLYYKGNEQGAHPINLVFSSNYNKTKNINIGDLSFIHEDYEVELISPTPNYNDRITKGKSFMLKINIKPVKENSETKYFVQIKENNNINIKYKSSISNRSYSNGNKIPISNADNTITCVINQETNISMLNFDIQVVSSNGIKKSYEYLPNIDVKLEQFLELNYNNLDFWYGIFHCDGCKRTNDGVFVYVKPSSVSISTIDNIKEPTKYKVIVQLLLDNENPNQIKSENLVDFINNINSRQNIQNSFTNVNEYGYVGLSRKTVFKESIFSDNSFWSHEKTVYKKGVETPYAKLKIIITYQGKKEYEYTFKPRVLLLNRDWKIRKEF